MNWRTTLLIIMMTLSVVDLLATFVYVYQYRHWQPNKPLNLIENNPLLVFLWNRLGFYYGSFVGFVVITSLVYIVGKYAHWSIALVLLLVLCFTIYNHAHNFTLLHKLIEQYPTGRLPEKVFGKVIGNN